MGYIIIEDESGEVGYYGRNMFDLVDLATDNGLTAQESERLLFIIAAIYDCRFSYASIYLSIFLGRSVKVSTGYIANQPEINGLF